MKILRLKFTSQPHALPEPDFTVITSHFNPCGYASLRQNYERFVAQMAAANVALYTVELAFNNAPFSIPKTSRVIQFRTHDVLWFKENLLNLVSRLLPASVRKVAWIDHDVEFSDPHWAQNASKLLDRFKVVQLFGEARDCDKQGNVVSSLTGVVKWAKQNPNCAFLDFTYCRPGFAWAAQRSFLDAGLYERQIVGSGDSWLASALLRKPLHPIMQNEVNPALRADIDVWTDTVQKWIHPGEVGYLDCLLRHHWHGDAGNRGYVERQKIIRSLDVATQLGKRGDGLLCWTSDTPEIMKAQMRDYFTLRQEDAGKRAVDEIGLVTAADSNFFPALRLWIEAAKRHWNGPLFVFDLGLTLNQVDWCRRHGVTTEPYSCSVLGRSYSELVEEIGRVQLNTWCKPFLLDRAPFKRIVWVDCDALILAPLTGLLEHLAQTGFVVYQESYNPPWTINKDVSELLPHKVKNDPYFTPNAGICAIDKTRQLNLLEHWKFAVTQALLNPELRKRLSCYDQGALNWALQVLGLRDCLKNDIRWNCPANKLHRNAEKLTPRTYYAQTADVLDQITADHPDVHIVHWMGERKLTHGWTEDLSDLKKPRKKCRSTPSTLS